MRPLNRLAAAGLALLFTAPALAQDNAIRLSIAAGRAGEVCIPLAQGDTLAWQFKSSAAADFNLHHHVDKQVLMPVDRKAVTEDRGEHRVERKNDWCLMWTAPAGQPLSVSGSWTLRKAGAP